MTETREALIAAQAAMLADGWGRATPESEYGHTLGLVRAALAAPAPAAVERALAHRIVSMFTWDEGGATGPAIAGLSWESLARMASDLARAALSPPEVKHGEATRMDVERLEEKAREIYNGWKYLKGWVPWVDGGNSFMQDKARIRARDEMAAQKETTK